MRRALCAGLLLAGCGGGDGPTGSSTLSTLRLRPDVAVQLLAGDSFQLLLTATDGSGREVGLPSPQILLRSSSTAVATVSDAGMVRVDGPGIAWIVAEATGVPGDSVMLEARQPSGVFHLTLLFAPDISDTVRALFAAAARRWERVLGGALDPAVLQTAGGDCPTIEGEPPTPPLAGTERGVIVHVGLSGRFTPGVAIDAAGGTCLHRALPRPTVVLGQVTLNRARPLEAMPPERQRFIAVHELGHALGLVGIVQGAAPPWFDIATGRFSGPMALEGYRRITGSLPEALSVRGGHWDGVPVTDVMNGGGLISFISIGALLDMGYPALWSGAGLLE